MEGGRTILSQGSQDHVQILLEAGADGYLRHPLLDVPVEVLLRHQGGDLPVSTVNAHKSYEPMLAWSILDHKPLVLQNVIFDSHPFALSQGHLILGLVKGGANNPHGDDDDAQVDKVTAVAPPVLGYQPPESQ